MDINFNYITLVITLGVIQGYFFCIIFINKKTGNRKANLILAVLLFFISTSICSSILIFTNLYIYVPYFVRLEIVLLFTFPSLLYFYVKALTVMNFNFKVKHLIHTIPIIASILVLLPFFLKDSRFKIEYVNLMLSGKSNTLDIVLIIILNIIELIYVIKILNIIKNHQSIIKTNFSSTEHIDLSWIKVVTILYIIAIFFALITSCLIIFLKYPYYLFYKYLPLFVSISIFYIGYKGLLQKDIFVEFVNYDIPVNKNDEKLFKKIEHYIENEKLFKNPDLNLSLIEKKVNISREKIAEIIFNNAGKNFYDYINKFRIEEAKNIIFKSNKNNLLNISFDVGFKSKEVFNRIFKQNTSMTPIQFHERYLLNRKTAMSNNTIGLFIDNLYDYYGSDILRGVKKFAKENGLKIICFNGGCINSNLYNFNQKSEIYNLAGIDNVDGIIALSASLGSYINKEELKKFYSQFHNIPIVNIGMKIDGMSSITIDNDRGLRDLLIHFIKDHGYKRIAFIKGPEHNPDAINRFNIYKIILKEFNIEYDPELVVPGKFINESGKNAVKILIDERKVKFDAIFAANDYMAIYAIKELESRDIRVPNDIAVAGFDDVIESRYLYKPLTTISQPVFEIGYQAAKILFNKINGDNTDVNLTLPTGLIIRESCGCIKQKMEYTVYNHLNANITEKLDVNSIKNFLLNDIIILLKTKYGGLVSIKQISEWINRIFDSILFEINNQKENGYLNTFRNIIKDSINYRIDIDFWQSAIGMIFDKINKSLQSKIRKDKLKNLIEKSKNVINQINNQQIENPVLNKYEQNMKMYLINQGLLTVDNIEDLQKVLIGELPKLGIKSCFISIYDKKTNENDLAEIIFAYKNYRKIIIDKNDNLFSVKYLVPDILIDIEDYNYVIMSLYFNDEQLGFIIFESDTEITTIYELLVTALSSAIKNIQLNEDLESKANLIQKETNILDKKNEKTNISRKKSEEYYNKLLFFMEKNKMYINPDLTLSELAEELNISSNNLSFIINKYTNLKFYDFINTYRVEEAKKYLIDSEIDNILEIAYNAGFKSKSTFNKIFKKYTQVTPSEYKMKNI